VVWRVWVRVRVRVSSALWGEVGRKQQLTVGNGRQHTITPLLPAHGCSAWLVQCSA
jgi:hypothetical protein